MLFVPPSTKARSALQANGGAKGGDASALVGSSMFSVVPLLKGKLGRTAWMENSFEKRGKGAGGGRGGGGGVGEKEEMEEEGKQERRK